MNSLVIIFVSILVVFLVSRFIALASLKWNLLPVNVLSNGARYHHFVWGNFLIVVSAFLVLGLGMNPNNVYLVACFGVGLGLVLDEFPHWVGNVQELTRNTPIIPGAMPAVISAELLILFLIVLKYFKLI